MQTRMRKDVPVEETWDLSLLYANEDDFNKDWEAFKTLSQEIETRYKNSISTPQEINAALDGYREVIRLMTLVSHYTDLAVSVDYYNSKAQDLNDRVSRSISEEESRLSFIRTSIAALPDEVIEKAKQLSKPNRLYLDGILREKPHMMAPEAEKAVKALSATINTPYQVYNMAKLADMKFPSFTVDGKEYPLGYSLFEDDYSYSPDTAVRRTAFKVFSDKIRQYENVTAAAYNAQVQTEKTLATMRGFDSVIDYLLFDQHVTREMYDRQIDMIMQDLAPHMRRLAKLIQKTYGLEKMTYADLKTPLDPGYAPTVSIAQCKEYVSKGLAILGDDYVSLVKKAFDERWIDFANNQGKSTGGFCASPYGKNSYILLSYSNGMSDVFTIAHELGHAGHFNRCNSAQSIFDTEVSTYFVEAPSTTNELIMVNYLLGTSDDKRFRRWVIANVVQNTYYHNFVTHLLEACYQREVYRIVDNGGSVNAEVLNGIMRDTLKRFWGDAVVLDEGAELTWMRQPHYYMGLYSYTYSAGLTVGTQVCKRIRREGMPAVEDWKKVLSAGSTLDPVGLARMAGVDITTDQPLRDTIAAIGEYITQLEDLS